YYPRLEAVLPPAPDVDSLLAHHDYLRLDPEARTIRILHGVHDVSTSVIVPPGFRLLVTAGTTLRFSGNAVLLSYGPIEFIGSKKSPVVLEPRQGARTWQGMVVMNAGLDSRLENVRIHRTKGISQGAWELTGGVTFYHSSVSIKDVDFEDNAGEDALNIVHSDFNIAGVRILRTASDAFDSDFSQGKVGGSEFREIGLLGGGDAIDVSGTSITVHDTRFRNIGDKALSVGEKSRMIARKVSILGAGTAAASKDGSLLEISDSEIEAVRTAGLMAYIKKPEYGGPRIVAENLHFEHNLHAARAQKGSSIVIDGEAVQPEDINVKAMYETIMKPGLRR
ncbi:MAG: hypothetical protein ACE5ET_10250, partial [Gammaproteobacteria bacterium]